jgi:hypothetical protein
VKLQLKELKLENKSISTYFKNETIRDRFFALHPVCGMILMDLLVWLWSRRVYGVCTETVSTMLEDEALKRVSSSHREGRAFDISTRGWPDGLALEAIEYLVSKHGHLGAISRGSGKPTLVVHHDAGTGPHLHVQINKQYAVRS